MVLPLAPAEPMALVLMPPLAVICLWVAWSDLKFMKIPNAAVLALGAVYLLLGPLVMPLSLWAWGWALGLVVLAAGLLSNAGGLIGAGDAKCAAAMAPFFAGADPRIVIFLLAGCLLAALAAHRLMGEVPAFRRATEDWSSWQAHDFPMGLALAGAMLFYFGQGLPIWA